MNEQSWHQVVGIHAVRAAIKHGKARALELRYDANRRDRRLTPVLEEAKQAGIKITPTDRATLDKETKGLNHQGVVLLTQAPAAQSEADLYALLDCLNEKPALLLVLDGVTDPHNLGACLRTADAAGVDAVVVPKDRAAGLTPVACKVASGAAENLPFIQVTNLARTLQKLANDYFLRIIGTAGEATESLYQADFRQGSAIVLGAEGQGMRRLVKERCDELVRIPMAGSVESLNVSVATGVCLFEAIRQRNT